ncbi:hypothetical protein [Gelidibacter sp. F63206]|uniref:hypothetical protein n=1 Tax=Gelidibacter sp. F63206 TaxID=2926425 RepID=UPI001FF2DBA0|nr:hypothetical protein [Gelidibacter sp. F63206]MCK0115183.1 hypothetical protein [Gelidibacter sp. F63206]
MRIIIVILLLVILSSCNSNKNVENFYRVYSSDMDVAAFYKIKSHYVGNKRVDSIFRYNEKGELEEEYQEYYSLHKNGITATVSLEENAKILQEYRTWKIDSCVETKENVGVKIQICYKGDKTLKINDRNYSGAHYFIERSMHTDGVERKKVFDDSFILLEEEYLSGFLKYYKIERMVKRPDVLK